jgi:hypothetical protein
VPWHQRGVATSSVQFFRTIGGAVTVAALGAMLNAHLAVGSLSSTVDTNLALNPETRAQIPPADLSALVSALDKGLGSVYLVMAGLAFLGVGVALTFPRGSAHAHAYKGQDGRSA